MLSLMSVLFCSVFSSNVLQTTSDTNSSLCLAEVVRLPLKVSSHHVFNWRWNQEAVVHGQLGVAYVRRTMTNKKYIGLHPILFLVASN